MSAASNGRVLRIALAGSVAVHLIIAAIVYSRPVTAAPEQRPQRTRMYRLAVPPPTPTPPPKRAMPHAQKRVRAVRPAIHNPVHIAVTKPQGPPKGPPVEPTGSPAHAETPAPAIAPTDAPIAPTPTPKPACSAPDVPAKTLVAQSPSVPEDQSGSFTGTAKVKVDLDPAGQVVGTSVYESTGNPDLDRAAVSAARESRYAPEERDCKNVGGSYLFTIDFQ